MKTTLKEFESVWPRIAADIAGHAKSYNLPQQPLDWFRQVRTAALILRPTSLHVPAVARLQHRRRQMQPRHVGRRHFLNPAQQDP